MNNYEVTDRRVKKMIDGKSVFQVVILADTPDDVPEPSEEWAPMSVCYIAEGDGCKVLNTQGVWCDV